jgi:predicted transcriptional regulator of viral defense system
MSWAGHEPFIGTRHAGESTLSLAHAEGFVPPYRLGGGTFLIKTVSTVSSTTPTRTLSGTQARLILSLLEDKKTTVNPAIVVERLGVHRNYAWKLLHELETKGWLHRYARGTYRIVPPEWGPDRLPNLDVHAAALANAPDGYVGLASAASLHGLTTQSRRVVFVLLSRRKREVELDGITIRFVTLKPAHLFGTEKRLELGESITVSDPEKTALDCLEYGIGAFDFTELTAVVARALLRGQWQRLAEYVRRFESGPLARRLGALGALAGITPAPVLLEALRSFPVPTTPITLDPTRPARHESLVDRNWGVRVNVAPSDLFRI